jgi:hypothetical protein
MEPGGIEWESLDPSVADVSVAGLIRARGQGSARIVASARGRADTVHVTVLPPIIETTLLSHVDTVTVIPETIEVEVGSRSAVGPRLGRYTAVARNTAVASPWIEDGSTTLRIVVLGAGTTYVVVQERGGTSDSIRVVGAQRATGFGPIDGITGFVGGTTQIHLAVFDANTRLIAEPTIAWRSDNPAVVSVSATGEARFLSLGATFIEARVGELLATIGVVVKEPTPGRVSFRTDSVAIGTALQTSLVIIDKTAIVGSPAVTLTPLDPTIVELAGVQTYGDGASATLIGRRAGVTRIVASAGTMIPDTLLVRVTTSRLEIIDRNLAVIDADEIPVGPQQNFGVIVRDSLGRAGIRATPITVTLRSSDESILRIIPGHGVLTLAAGDVGIPLAGVMPVARGRVTLYATSPGLLADSVAIIVAERPRLKFMPSGIHTAAVGYKSMPGRYAIGTSLGPDRGTDVTITLSRAHPNVATMPATVSLPPNYVYREIPYTGLAVGIDTIIATAPGYDPDTAVLVVTAPKLRPNAPITATVSGGGALWLQVTDSLGNEILSTEPVTFRITSSDTGVASPPELVTVPKDVFWNWGTTAGAVDTGTATITITETTGRIAPQSTPITVPLDSTLGIGNFGEPMPLALGTRQRLGDDGVFVSRGGFSPPTVVYLRSTDPAILRVPDSLVLARDIRLVPVPVAGGDIPGSASIIATARGYRPATLGPIDVRRPHLELVAPTEVFVGGSGHVARVVTRDHRGTQRRTDESVSIALAALDGGITAPSSVTIPAGASSVENVPLAFTAPGTLRLAATDPRTGATYRYEGDTGSVRVVLPSLSFLATQIIVGVGQRANLSIGRPSNVIGQPVTVSVARSGAHTASANTIEIPGGLSGVDYPIVGRAIGADVLTASAPGYIGRSVRVVVTEGRINFPLGRPATVQVGKSFVAMFVATDSLGRARVVDAPTTFNLWGTGVSFTDGERPITSITIPAGASQTSAFRIVAEKEGTATVQVTNLFYQPARFEVTVVP